jgi:hypothetical protein
MAVTASTFDGARAEEPIRSPRCCSLRHGGSFARLGTSVPLRHDFNRRWGIPDFSGIQTENRMTDPTLALEALQIGRRQGDREVAAIKAAWKV